MGKGVTMTDPKNIGRYQVSTAPLRDAIYVTIIDTTTGKVEETFSVPWKVFEVRKRGKEN